jgi:hypothetical protein
MRGALAERHIEPALWPAAISVPATSLILFPAVFYGAPAAVWWLLLAGIPFLGLATLLPRRTAAFGFGLLFGWNLAALLLILTLFVLDL